MSSELKPSLFDDEVTVVYESFQKLTIEQKRAFLHLAIDGMRDGYDWSELAEKIFVGLSES